jgi:hypothetical protein
LAVEAQDVGWMRREMNNRDILRHQSLRASCRHPRRVGAAARAARRSAGMTQRIHVEHVPTWPVPRQISRGRSKSRLRRPFPRAEPLPFLANAL